MTTDVLPVAESPQRAARPAAAQTELTWRASLNLVQSILDYSAKLAVNLFVIPILVAGLGRSTFGVWEMLGRLMGYLESTDGRPTQALRLMVSNLQSRGDPALKRSWIGSALVVWACFLPVWIATGALLIWLAPVITGVAEPLHPSVRVACAILMAGVLLSGLAALPESVLRGMNLGYKRMGVQAGLSVVGGALVVGAVSLDLGLVGVALASVVLSVLTGICFLMLVRSQVPWFGVNRPSGEQVGALLQMSLWIAAGDAVSKLLLASDVVVLGAVLSPAMVTTYVLTGYAALLAVNLHALAADAAIPGLAGIIGAGDRARAAQLRRELLAVSLLFATGAGAAILVGNRSFVHLWVGSDNYAGLWANLLLVLIATQTAFIRCDSYIIDAALQPGRRVRVSAIAAVVAVLLSIVLTHFAGIIGLCVGILVGRSVQTVWYPQLVRSCLQAEPPVSGAWLVRPLAVTGALFCGAALLGQRMLMESWISWVAAVILSFGLAAAISFRWGLPIELRAGVQSRGVELASRIRQGAGRVR